MTNQRMTPQDVAPEPIKYTPKMSDSLPTIDEVLEQYANYLHDGWSGNKPTTPTINRKEAKAHLERLMAAERLDELKHIENDNGTIYSGIDGQDLKDRIAQLTHQAQAGGEETK